MKGVGQGVESKTKSDTMPFSITHEHVSILYFTGNFFRYVDISLYSQL